MQKGSISKNAYRTALNLATRLLGIKTVRVLDARVRFGRRLNLEEPRNLADKVSWLGLNTDRALPARCTDKYEVRDYLREKGLGDILIPLLGGPWTDADTIDFDALPDQFVLKATHGSQMNLICQDKRSFDVASARRTVKSWLRHDYARACLEPHYQLIERRAYCEQYLPDARGLVDYKFHCIHGKPQFILTSTDGPRGAKLNMYDTEWNPLRVLVKKINPDELEAPSRLKDMLQICGVLSEDFPFVRVDLYEVGGQILFGELTFSPAAGVFPNFSEEFLFDRGKQLVIR